MKLKFISQPHQTNAIQAVLDCFADRQKTDPRGFPVRILSHGKMGLDVAAYANGPLAITPPALLDNINRVQSRQTLPPSTTLTTSEAGDINLDIEMETGTGKTYCYLKTIFELHKTQGWSKFAIIVPSIAIREGVIKSLQITRAHFSGDYDGQKIRFFAYNSKKLYRLEEFASDGGINVMVINIQAFNSTGRSNRRIYEQRDEFGARVPMDVICATRPILIIDEPQKMGKRTVQSLVKFNPLLILRYSATHRDHHDLIHRLDAIDAFQQGLVKKIAVRAVSVKNTEGLAAYLYFESLELSNRAPEARIEMECRQKNGIRRLRKTLRRGDNLHQISAGLEQYQGYIVTDINAARNILRFENGLELSTGDATGDVSESRLRRIQIRESIKAHFEKERALYARDIKTLSLFFIDAVAKYRDYTQEDQLGEYARAFEEEYDQQKAAVLAEVGADSPYGKYLGGIVTRQTHGGYFSIDKKSKRLIDPAAKRIGLERGMSDDAAAYDLILKDKERLLSFTEPVRFIFSHSALREGWDNPNVFVMCMLKHGAEGISRRQEVGRGLRLCVNQDGERIADGASRDINTLTVVVAENYHDFVANLQREISDGLRSRPRQATESYFTNKTVHTLAGEPCILPHRAVRQFHRYLVKNGYVDDEDHVTDAYMSARAQNALSELPEGLLHFQTDDLFQWIDALVANVTLPEIKDDRRARVNPLNANFHKKEFQQLWRRINRRAVYHVKFDSDEMVRNAIRAINQELRVPATLFTVTRGAQKTAPTTADIQDRDLFNPSDAAAETSVTYASAVRYDLVGKVARLGRMSRGLAGAILSGLEPTTFAQYRRHPEIFISEVARLISEQRAAVIVNRISYDLANECYDTALFTAEELRRDFSRATQKLNKHIYDHVLPDSEVERRFAEDLDAQKEVIVYAKLPRGFQIPTPVGAYNPDWAIVFDEHSVRHMYFVAETKGTLASLQLRQAETAKIECARRFFARLNANQTDPAARVKYDVVDGFEKLLQIVTLPEKPPR